MAFLPVWDRNPVLEPVSITPLIVVVSARLHELGRKLRGFPSD
jgi:hypothetical protein